MSNTYNWIVEEDTPKQRLDLAIALFIEKHSRSQIQQWIKNKHVKVNDLTIMQPKHIVKTGDTIQVELPEIQEETWDAESGELCIAHEDDHCLVLNKPANLTMHPGAGQRNGTLMNYVLGHLPNQHKIPRCGMIHRLDKDTTGLCVVAKSTEAYHALVQDMQKREIERTYQAILLGQVHFPETIDQPIGRHPTQRTLMAIHPEGKPAITHLTPLEIFQYHSHVELKLESGRTHQIRVHTQHIRHPVLGDPRYGQQHIAMPELSDTCKTMIKNMKRQCLHAIRLAFTHPIEKKKIALESPLPIDFKNILLELKCSHGKS